MFLELLKVPLPTLSHGRVVLLPSRLELLLLLPSTFFPLPPLLLLLLQVFFMILPRKPRGLVLPLKLLATDPSAGPLSPRTRQTTAPYRGTNGEDVTIEGCVAL